jgi:HSP20 family protein
MTELAKTADPAPSTRPTAPDPLWADVDRTFRRFYGGLFGAAATEAGEAQPWLAPAPTDVADRGESYELRFDLPGLTKEEVDIRVTGDLVQVRAQHKGEERRSTDGYLRVERSWSGFERAVELPETVRSDAVVAKLENGVLTVTVPKEHPVVERKISVQ